MPFDPAKTKTPKGVGTIVITLKDIPASTIYPPHDAQQTASIQVNVLDVDDNPLMTYSTDLFKHLTVAQQTTLKNFLTLMRTKAMAEVVPTTP